MSFRADKGQSSVEAALLIPVLFVTLLALLQPGIILYDRMVMESAAAEGCRLLATKSDDAGMTDERCTALVKRHLGAIPQQDLFHVHGAACSYEIELSGDEHANRCSVTIRNQVKLLPLFDVAGALLGMADEAGRMGIEVTRSAPTQPAWAAQGANGLDPDAWVTARKEDA